MARPRISIPRFMAKLRDNLDFVGSYEPVLGDVITPVFQVDEQEISGPRATYLTDPSGADLATQDGALKVFSSEGSSVVGPDGAHELVLTSSFASATPSVGTKLIQTALHVPEGGHWYWFGDSVLEVSDSFINRAGSVTTQNDVISVGVLAIFPSPVGGQQERVAFHTATGPLPSSNMTVRTWDAFPGSVGNSQTRPSEWILPTQARSSFPTFVPAGQWPVRVAWRCGKTSGTAAAGAGLLLTIPYAAAG